MREQHKMGLVHEVTIVYILLKGSGKLFKALPSKNLYIKMFM